MDRPNGAETLELARQFARTAPLLDVIAEHNGMQFAAPRAFNYLRALELSLRALLIHEGSKTPGLNGHDTGKMFALPEQLQSRVHALLGRRGNYDMFASLAGLSKNLSALARALAAFQDGDCSQAHALNERTAMLKACTLITIQIAQQEISEAASSCQRDGRHAV